MFKNLLFAVILISLIACTTPVTGDLPLKHQDVIAYGKTQFKYVSGELKPKEDYNYYISRSSQNARESILYAILERDFGKKYVNDLANNGLIEKQSRIKIVSVSKVKTEYSQDTHWASSIYTTVDVKLSNGTTRRVKYKSVVALASSVISDEPITSLSSFEVIRIKSI